MSALICCRRRPFLPLSCSLPPRSLLHNFSFSSPLGSCSRQCVFFFCVCCRCWSLSLCCSSSLSLVLVLVLRRWCAPVPFAMPFLCFFFVVFLRRRRRVQTTTSPVPSGFSQKFLCVQAALLCSMRDFPRLHLFFPWSCSPSHAHKGGSELACCERQTLTHKSEWMRECVKGCE